MRWTPLTDHLIVGGRLEVPDWLELWQLGVRAELNLQLEEPQRFFGAREPEAYLWLPVEDFTSPNVMQMVVAADFIQACVAHERPVYVHCYHGVGRSPLVCAAYLMRHQGLAPNAAWDYIAQRRPFVGLNDAQRAGLEAFAHWLQNGRP